MPHVIINGGGGGVQSLCMHKTINLLIKINIYVCYMIISVWIGLDWSGMR